MSMDIGGGKSKQENKIDPRLERAVLGNYGRTNEMIENMPSSPQAYAGDWVAQLNNQQNQGLDAQFNRGQQGSAQEQSFDDYISRQLSQNVDPSAIQGMGSQYARQGQMGQNVLRHLSQNAMGLDDASQFTQGGGSPYDAGLQSAASGQINPLTSQAFQQAAGDLTEQFNESVMPGINASFASAGRTGSGAQARAQTDAAGELSDSMAGLAASMFGNASESALGRQLAASQAGLADDVSRRGIAANLYGGDRSAQTNAASNLAQSGLSGLGQLGNIYGTQVGQQGQAAGLAPEAQRMDYTNINQMLAAGNQRQDQQQAQQDAARARYDQNSMIGVNNFNREMNARGQMMQQLGYLTGNNTQTGKQYGGSASGNLKGGKG